MTWALMLTPLVLAGRMLHHLDVAAKQHKGPKQIWLVDLFSLIFLIQLPLAIVTRNTSSAARFTTIVAVVLCVLMILVWWATIKTISQAGIVGVYWRSTISLFVIPMAYIGSFVLAGNAPSLFLRRNNDARALAMTLEIVLFASLLLSFYLVKRAIRSAQLSTEDSG